MRPRSRRLVVAAAAVLALAATALVSATAKAATPDPVVTASGSGMHGGYYYAYWNGGVGPATMTLTVGGGYSTTWNNSIFFAGKGWQTGARRTVGYSATFNVQGNGFLSLYGWLRNPWVEYYVLDNWGSWNPGTNATKLGSVVSDGGVYDIYRYHHVSPLSRRGGVAPQSIVDGSWDTYWSIRQQKRSSGNITFGNHLDAWVKAGLTAGTFDYQVLATEGYQSSGTSSVTVNEIACARCEPPTTSPTTTSATSTGPTGTTTTSSGPTRTGPKLTTVKKCRTDKKGRRTCRTVTRTRKAAAAVAPAAVRPARTVSRPSGT